MRITKKGRKGRKIASIVTHTYVPIGKVYIHIHIHVLYYSNDRVTFTSARDIHSYSYLGLCSHERRKTVALTMRYN